MARRGRYGAISGCAWRNRKLQAVSMAAQGFYWACLSYVADQATGGHLRPDEMHALGRGHKHAGRWRKELTAHGLLHETDGGYYVHDYADWNRVFTVAPTAAPTREGTELPTGEATEGITGAPTEGITAAARGEQKQTLASRPLITQDPLIHTEVDSIVCLDPFGTRLMHDTWWTRRNQSPPALVGKALDEAARRVGMAARAWGLPPAEVVPLLCESARAHQQANGGAWAFALRDCELRKPAAAAGDDSVRRDLEILDHAGEVAPWQQ